MRSQIYVKRKLGPLNNGYHHNAFHLQKVFGLVMCARTTPHNIYIKMFTVVNTCTGLTSDLSLFGKTPDIGLIIRLYER